MFLFVEKDKYTKFFFFSSISCVLLMLRANSFKQIPHKIKLTIKANENQQTVSVIHLLKWLFISTVCSV